MATAVGSELIAGDVLTTSTGASWSLDTGAGSLRYLIAVINWSASHGIAPGTPTYAGVAMLPLVSSSVTASDSRIDHSDVYGLINPVPGPNTFNWPLPPNPPGISWSVYGGAYEGVEGTSIQGTHVFPGLLSSGTVISYTAPFAGIGAVGSWVGLIGLCGDVPYSTINYSGDGWLRIGASGPWAWAEGPMLTSPPLLECYWGSDMPNVLMTVIYLGPLPAAVPSRLATIVG